MLLLLWLELRSTERTTAIFNKAVPHRHCLLWLRCSVRKSPPAVLGGEGRRWKAAFASCSSGGRLGASDGKGILPLAGLGGEGWESSGAFPIDVGRCAVAASACALLAGRGDEEEKRRGVQMKMLSSYLGGVAGASSEWKDLPLLRAPWWSSSVLSSDRCWKNKPVSWIPLRGDLLRLPPPTLKGSLHRKQKNR